MARAIPLLLALAWATLPIMPAHSADAPSRPPGVSAPAWVPISDSLGFVIQQKRPARAGEQLPAALGYFVVKRDGHWLRLDSLPAASLWRGPLQSN